MPEDRWDAIINQVTKDNSASFKVEEPEPETVSEPKETINSKEDSSWKKIISDYERNARMVYKNKLHQLDKAKERINSSLEQLEKNPEAINTEIENQINNTLAQLTTLEDENEKTEEELEQIATSVSKAKNSGHEDEILELYARYTTIADTKKENDEKIIQLRDKLAAINTAGNSKNKYKASLLSDLKALKQEYEDLEDTITSHENELNLMKGRSLGIVPDPKKSDEAAEAFLTYEYNPDKVKKAIIDSGNTPINLHKN